MSSIAPVRKSPIQCILDDPPVIDILAHSIDHGATKASAEHLPAYAGQKAYYETLKMASWGLKSLGFERKQCNNQYRLHCEAREGYHDPVRLLFARGNLEGGNMVFSGRKGPETKKVVLQNEIHFGLQPPIPELAIRRKVDRVGNVFVIYDFDDFYYCGYLALGVRLSGYRLTCVEYARFTEGALGAAQQPTVEDVPPEPTGYDFDFEERGSEEK